MALPDGVSRDSIRAVYESLIGSGTSAQTTQGNVASGATDSGNPVKVGGVYNTTLPTLTNGQRGDVQLDVNGNLRTAITAFSQTITAGIGAVVTFPYATNAAATSRPFGTMPYKHNGASLDPDRKPSGASRIPSAAGTTNATVAKASAGDLWTITGTNASAAVKYLKFYNVASAPTVGTTAIVLTLALPVGAFRFNMAGHYFGTGIAYALTGLAADADTTALAAADILGLNVTYA